MKNKLNVEVLLNAYAQGFFPMPDPETDEIHWYKPNPRAIIPLDQFHISRSLKKIIQRKTFNISFDKRFKAVMKACADRPETWINDEILEAYIELHRIGFAHSVEIYQEGALVGGLYGVSLGRAFFAESMFHKASNASKVALYYLVEILKDLNFLLLEVQFLTPHLKSLGAVEISDEDYMKKLSVAMSKKGSKK